MNRMNTQHNSIRKKLLLPMAAVLLLQAGFFMGTIIWGGTTDQLDDNAFDILSERVINRKNYLQNAMVQYWSNFSDSYDVINQSILEQLEESSTGLEQLQVDPNLAEKLLSQTGDELIYMLRRTTANSAYVVLGAPTLADGTTLPQLHTVYVRDLDPSANPSDRSDLFLENGPASQSKAMRISLGSNWAPQLQVNPTTAADQLAFVQKPYDAALKNPNSNPFALGYWAPVHSLSGPSDVQVISFSVPLLDLDGNPYGVLGVDITLDQLQKQMPYSELMSDKHGAYLLAMDSNNDMTFSAVAASGPVFRNVSATAEQAKFLERRGNTQVYTLATNERTQDKVFGSIQYLRLYNPNSPYESDAWALVGIAQERYLLGFSRSVIESVSLSLALSLLLGFIAIVFAGSRFAKPIADLVGRVQASDPRKVVDLGKTNIQEIDTLAASIEALSSSVADSSSKLAQILSLTNIAIGAYEYTTQDTEVYCTGSFFPVLELSSLYEGSYYLDKTIFNHIMREATLYAESSEEDTFRLQGKNGYPKWVKIQEIRDGDKILGVVEDVTEETIEKRKIEYERDYDLLTNLYNRRAFQSVVSGLLANANFAHGALVMWDLDNLKTINDTYGHDSGDDYIRSAASALRQLSLQGGIVSRMSGDEFYVFLYGDNKELLTERIRSSEALLLSTIHALPDSSVVKVSASAGVAWYPQDAQTYEELLRFADFAMYSVKNSGRGRLVDFSREDYERNSYIQQTQKDFIQLVEEELVRFAFQPIVDAHTGEIFAFEALMRPQMPSLPSPPDVLRIATAKGKLGAIERLTWFKALQDFDREGQAFPHARLFVNSIPNCLMSDTETALFESRFGAYLSRLVMEIIENEQSEEHSTRIKKSTVQRWGAGMALDDFGAGYSNEIILLTLNPDIVKIDMTIVRGIDKDLSRQKILHNLISYSRERGIRVVAEGVEDADELNTLISLGVDFLQGYYLARPAFEPKELSKEAKEEICRLAALHAHD